MLAAIVLAGAAAGPGAALAANECGDPETNTTGNDTFTCNGTFASITYPATNGNLTLSLQNNLTTTTGGLVVTASGINNVTINRVADTVPNAGDPSLTNTSGAGLQVTSAAGGTIIVSMQDPATDTGDAPMVIAGTTAGVFLRNAGTANTSFNSSNGTITATAGAGIDLASSSVGAGNVSITNGATVTASTYGLRAATSGTGPILITNNGVVTGGTGAIQITNSATVTITNGATRVLNGIFTVTNTGTMAFTNNGAWNFTGSSTLGAGAATVQNSATGAISATGTSSIDFAAGEDALTNTGLLAVGGLADAATLTLGNLEKWNNNGRVLFGANGGQTATDGVANDRLVARGLIYNGGGARLFMDVDLSGAQTNCDAAIAADCLDLRDAVTSELSTIVVNPVGGALTPGHRIVLVDVRGAGSSAADNFELDTTAPDYRQVGSIDTIESGLLFYGLVYDGAKQQHAIVTGFNDRAFALSRVGRAASEPWRTTTGMWHERQADLRDTLEGGEAGAGPGVWLKVAGGVINEKRTDEAADQVRYNTSASQRTSAIVGGLDLVRRSGAGGAFVAGVTAGKFESTLDYRAIDSELQLDGRSLGAYASFVTGRLFVDAIVNTTDMDLTHNDGAVAYEGSASTAGYQVEGGWRLFQANDDGAYVEPLLALAYVKSDVDDLTIGGVTSDFGEASSLRGALGLRVAGGMAMEALTARLSFTGRVWQELNGDNVTTTFSGAFGDADLIEESPDMLGDVGAAISLLSPGGRLSANLGLGLVFKKDYQSTNASLSVRYSW